MSILVNGVAGAMPQTNFQSDVCGILLCGEYILLRGEIWNRNIFMFIMIWFPISPMESLDSTLHGIVQSRFILVLYVPPQV